MAQWACVDSHCHLDMAKYDADRDDVVRRAEAAGVMYLVNPAIDLESAGNVIALTKRWPQLYGAVGVHPNDCADFDGATLEALRLLAAEEKVVAIGEIGLDYYWRRVPARKQKDVLWQQLLLAAELGLPVIIHDRDAHDDVERLLTRWANEVVVGSKLDERAFIGVLHAFSGDVNMGKRMIARRFLLSVGGPITFKNDHGLRGTIALLPLSRIMLETDAPFLSPHPFRGKRNEPARIPLIAEAIANLYDKSTTEICAVTTETAKNFFGFEAMPRR